LIKWKWCHCTLVQKTGHCPGVCHGQCEDDGGGVDDGTKPFHTESKVAAKIYQVIQWNNPCESLQVKYSGIHEFPLSLSKEDSAPIPDGLPRTQHQAKPRQEEEDWHHHRPTKVHRALLEKMESHHIHAGKSFQTIQGHLTHPNQQNQDGRYKLFILRN